MERAKSPNGIIKIVSNSTSELKNQAMNIDILINKLKSWNFEDRNFHVDRQLADEILIIDGWQVEPDEYILEQYSYGD